MAEVRIRGIVKSYTSGVPVLKGVDLDIRPGELFFLLGPSGCGKSTLLRILAGLVKPDGGSISFDGTDIGSLPPEKRHAAMVFQNYALWPHMDVFENVAFGLKTSGVRGRELKEKVMEALELVRLADFARRRVPALSGGQQQRVALARALAVQPALLLLDEPLSNLDARLRDAMRSEIRRICSLRNLTALYVTHDRQEALSMADRIGVMHGGLIREMGDPEELYNFPRSRFCAQFLGDVNIIDGSVRDGSLMTPFGTFKLNGKAGPGCVAGIRPERIRIVEPGRPGSFEAVLEERVFSGDTCDWTFRVGEQRLFVRESAPESRRIGATYHLAFEPDFLLALTDADGE
ncbi:MAG: ABC transporter ATP-binding protein [Lentisphaeria bacterium]|nr:ABC transporter ATP-binding protein [Lentisphaeria bacterium]